MSNLAVIQTGDAGGFYQSGSSGEGGEKQSDSGYILSVETVGFPNTVALICERRKKGVQSDPKSFGSSHQKDGVEMGKAVGWTGWWGRSPGGQFGTR